MIGDLNPAFLDAVSKLYRAAAVTFGSMDGVEWWIAIVPDGHSGIELDLRVAAGPRDHRRKWRLMINGRMIVNERDRIADAIAWRVRDLRARVVAGE